MVKSDIQNILLKTREITTTKKIPFPKMHLSTMKESYISKIQSKFK